MELRVLNYFLAIAREENITKAAQMLHVSQPALSRQMMQLEDELGVKLFYRTQHCFNGGRSTPEAAGPGAAFPGRQNEAGFPL